ncbi:MAG: hypothetical protein IJ506_06820 [Clostridia bacterium]|nr:hypothetical protein [Clostridia bacterium]
MKTTANKSKRIPAPTKKAMALTDMRSEGDFNGSYTGTPEKGEKPMQDADDL